MPAVLACPNQERNLLAMSEDKPDPLDDMRRGMGLLFRAAKTVVQRIPTTKLEDAVVSGAREVGRAIENVAQTLEKEVLKKTGAIPPEPSVRVDVQDAAKPPSEPPPGGPEDKPQN
jgi:hypothetical protein